MTTNLSRLRHFVQAFTHMLDAAGGSEESILAQGQPLLAQLIAQDDWLPPAFAEPDPAHYTQYLLHCDPLERFSVTSFVWGPGQSTPLHDHTVWGMIGVLRGAETCEEYSKDLRPGGAHRLGVGAIDLVSPRLGDFHRVSNSYGDRVSVSIHVYGANIGKVARHVYDPATGKASEFVSGYANEVLPNLWV
jgi:predicted metal-dependent enzyme (double-stranded beta helix superfamily)